MHHYWEKASKAPPWSLHGFLEALNGGNTPPEQNLHIKRVTGWHTAPFQTQQLFESLQTFVIKKITCRLHLQQWSSKPVHAPKAGMHSANKKKQKAMSMGHREWLPKRRLSTDERLWILGSNILPCHSRCKNRVSNIHTYRHHFESLPTRSQAEKLKAACSSLLLIPPAWMAWSCNLNLESGQAGLSQKGPVDTTQQRWRICPLRARPAQGDLVTNACKPSAGHMWKHHKP